MGNTSRRFEYVRLVSKASGEGLIATAKKMNMTKKKFGVTFREYYQREFWKMSLTQQARESKKTDGNHNRKERAVKHIMDETGMTREEIAGKIRALNDLGLYYITSFVYDRFEMFRLNDEEAKDFVRTLTRRQELIDSLRESFKKIDKGELSYDDVASELQEYEQIMNTIVPDSLIEASAEKLEPAYPGITEDKPRLRKVAIDMESVRSLLKFNNVEYIMFDFINKTLPERRSFINEEERAVVLNSVNDMSQADNLDNKYITYQYLAPYYGRDMIHVSSETDFEKFESFCHENHEFVRKLDFDSMGRGVVPYKAEGNLKQLFKSLLVESPDGFICEGLIKAHPVISALNPDSVNTVRLITYFDGTETHVQKCFMKIGQKGSFVDNGGAGGIFAAVNDEKGFFESNGIDEKGRRYDTHPYTGITIEGYQLPAWEEALALGREISSKIPGFSYIGWDLTYTEDCKWVIVEGNSITQFLGQQSTRNLGAKKSLLDLVGFTGDLY